MFGLPWITRVLEPSWQISSKDVRRGACDYKTESQHLIWTTWNLPAEETTAHLGIMKGLAVDFSFALLLLVDLVLGLAAQPFPGLRPDALLRGMSGGPRRIVQRQQTSRLNLYMMQLYRTMLTEDRAKTPMASVGRIWTEDNPALHDSDSVISLVAKSEYSTADKKNAFFLWSLALWLCTGFSYNDMQCTWGVCFIRDYTMEMTSCNIIESPQHVSLF